MQQVRDLIREPNSDQAGREELQGGVTEAIRRFFLNEFEGMLPARVVSYDDATNRAVIQPLVMMGTTGGGKVSRAKVPNIPVYRFGGGGFFMRFPIKPGDLGWLKANDRDISLIFQRGGLEDWPNTTRLHKFSDAMFFPDTFRGWVIDGADINAAVWQSVDGSTVISLRRGEVNIRAGGSSFVMNDAEVAITSPLLTHNGVNIGNTHTHTGSPTAPNGPVSPTGVPTP